MAFKLAKPVQFGRKPKEADGVRPFIGKAGNIRQAALAIARDVLTVLPGPGESLHAIMNGRWDLTDLLAAVFEREQPVTHMRIATLSFNRHNLHLMGDWCRAGVVGKLTLLYSLYFADNTPELVQEMRQQIPEARTAAARNHCKVVTLDFANGRKWSIEGSANLRTNSNTEQVAIIDSPDLHAFHSWWIDRDVEKHEAK